MLHFHILCTLIWFLTELMSSEAINRVPANYESRLFSDLFKDYNRNARPIANVTQPVKVSIAFYLTKILALDEKNQILTTFGWLEVHWIDEYLTWNPENYGGLERIIVPPQMIWLPDFGLENSADSIYDEQSDRKFRAGVNSDGSIQWVPGGRFTTSCQLDITYYPFDSQECELDFVDWTYDGRFVALVNGSDAIVLSVFRSHGEWDVVATEALGLSQFFDSDPGVPFPTVRFRMCLRRKPRFYLINVAAPCILMSILDLLVFYLPSDSGEKVSLGMTVLLSYSVFLLLIAENVPKTSDCVPLIGIYLTMVMAMTASSVVVSVLVLDLHHHEPNSSVPRWLRRLAFDVMGRLLRVVTTKDRDLIDQRAHSSMSSEFNMTRSRSSRVFKETTAAAAEAAAARQQTRPGGGRHYSANNSTSTVTGITVQENSEEDGELFDRSEDNGVRCFRQVKKLAFSGVEEESLCEYFKEIRQHTRSLTERLKVQTLRDEVRDEWRLLAKVLDRFFLIFFVISISVFTVSILYVYPTLVRNSGCQSVRRK